MASDTTLAATGAATGTAKPTTPAADILGRLTPDDLYPARLTGPHAWYPWGLTAAPPTDRHLRLTLPAGTHPDTDAGILDRLEYQLGRSPWPPDSPLDIRRHDRQLHCRDDDARRSLIEITVAHDVSTHGQAEVVTRDGWPIVNELAALHDRIRSINVDEPLRVDLADLTSWVKYKMTETANSPRLAMPLPELLATHAREHPASTDRLRTILEHRTVTAIHQPRVLDYLAEQLDHYRTSGHGQRH